MKLAANRDLVSEARLVFHMILGPRHLIARIGVSCFTRLRHDPPGSYSTELAGRPKECSYYVRFVSNPRFFGGTAFGNHSRTRSGKAIVTRHGRGHSLIAPQGYTVRRTYILSPGGPPTGLDPAPASKRMTLTSCARRLVCSRAVSVGQFPSHAFGEPLTPLLRAKTYVPHPPADLSFVSIAAMYPGGWPTLLGAFDRTCHTYSFLGGISFDLTSVAHRT